MVETPTKKIKETSEEQGIRYVDIPRAAAHFKRDAYSIEKFSLQEKGNVILMTLM